MAGKKGKGAGGGAAAVAELPRVAIAQGTTPSRIGVTMYPVGEIVVREKQDRTRDAAFQASVRELAANIAQVGLKQPICVRVAGAGYELVFGERRLLACRELGWTEIPAIEASTDEDVLAIRAAENLQREDLNEDQKADVVARMLDRIAEQVASEQGVAKGAEVDAPTRDAIRVAAVKRLAERFGWPVQRVRDYAFIAELPEKVRALGAEGRLSLSHLRVLAQVPDPKLCEALAEQSASRGEEAPMRALESLRMDVSRIASRLDLAPWDMSAAFAGAPSCNACPHNSRNRTGLFDGQEIPFYQNGDGKKFGGRPPEQGVCLRLECFKAKTAETKAAVRKAADSIAGKLAALKPAERAGGLARLVRERQEKATFVRPTVFGKEVRERVESKLEPAKGGGRKAAASAGGEARAASDRARYDAEWKWRDAVRDWREGLLRMVRAALSERPAVMMLLDALAGGASFHGAGYGDGPARRASGHKPKPGAANRAKQLIDLAFAVDDPAATAVARDVQDDDGHEWLSDYQWENAELLGHLCGQAGVPFTAPPKLDDFLPKPKPAPEAKEHPAGKGGKGKPAGKTKAARKGGAKSDAAAVDAGGDHLDGEDADA